MRLLGLLMCMMCIPTVCQAAVIINEIAWMGSAVSANDEWIELYNSGDSAVSLDGWVLEDGMNLSIALSGSLASGAYGVLERTDDSSAPGTALLIYTGALTNTGATLVLRRADSSIEDQVAGGEDWKNIGGDNTTKETAQYTNSGWVTAPATAGASNALIGTESDDDIEEDKDEDTTQEKQTTKKKSSSGNETVQLVLPDVSLALEIDAPDIVYVHQQIELDVIPSGIGKSLLDSLQYQWNFGDFGTASKKSASHTFSYPGEYVVTVYAEYARHEQIARKTIKVLPVVLSMTRNLGGDIQVHNNAKYEIDVSKYTLSSDGATQMVFPERSVLLPQATITIPKEKMNITHNSYIRLLDQKGSLVAALNFESYNKPVQSYTSSVVATAPRTVQVAGQKDSDQSRFSFGQTATVTAVKATEIESEQKNAPTANVSQAGNGEMPKEALPLLGLLGVIAVGLLGVYMRKV